MEMTFICLNDQVDLKEVTRESPTVYAAPDDFEDGKPLQAVAFLKWFAAWLDIDWPGVSGAEVKFWDGRTMCVLWDDGECVANLTFVFEPK